MPPASQLATLPPLPPIDKRFRKPVREMLCLYGPPGGGKTHMALTLASWHQTLGSDRHFYVLSTDQSYGPLLTNEEFIGLENITIEEPTDLDEAIKVARRFRASSRSGDWVFVDRIDHLWGWAQDEYAAALARQQGTTIEDMGDLWKVSGVNGDYPIKGWDWGGINARYRAFRSTLTSSPAHLLVMTEEKALLGESASGKSSEPDEIKAMFRHVGMKPTGQKEDASVWHTIIHVEAKRPRQQHVITAKERWGNRPYLGNEMTNGSYKSVKLDDFFMGYFVEVAKWTTTG